MDSANHGIQDGAAKARAAEFGDRVDMFLRSQRSLIIAAICGYAFLRILIFSAAFPLFNPLDEQDHFETVERYAHGYVPESELPQTGPEMARLFAVYSSPEYLISRQRLRAVGMDVPVTQMPVELKDSQYQKRFGYWSMERDTEAQSPPVYYIVAGGWYKLGAMLGAKDWALAYWVRFLNAGVYGFFVWISFLFVKRVYPDRDFLGVGIPAFLAVFPQDVFFGINRDILSPLLVALALLLLFDAMREGVSSYFDLIAGAFLVGIAFLTDVSNCVLFGALAVALCVVVKRAVRKGAVQKEFAMMLAAAIAAVVPPALWVARNRLVIGDLTGLKAKIAYLGWTVKPWSEMWQHPIFSLHGSAYFLQEVIKKYWRGESLWEGRAMQWSVADGFYVVSSFLLLAAFATYLAKWSTPENRLSRISGLVSLYLFVASVLFLATISLPFDFHRCFYPSHELPYFVSGRIICGTLLPFALIYLSGFEYLWRPVRSYVHPVIPLAVFLIFVTCSEMFIRRDVFHSAFNFLSLLGN
jgi:hypothetical protein